MYDLKFDLKNHKDILQLKFFVMSYVNSLERRKYVAVRFSSIQERIHVRNCLLMKKMSDVHVFPILSVILTQYYYIILTDYPGIQFHRYIS